MGNKEIILKNLIQTEKRDKYTGVPKTKNVFFHPHFLNNFHFFLRLVKPKTVVSVADDLLQKIPFNSIRIAV